MEKVKKVKLTKQEKKDLYVDPKQFWNEIEIFYSKNDGKFPLQLGMMVEKIANKLSFAGNYINYTFRDEMIADAKEKMISVILDKKFKLYTYTLLDKKHFHTKSDGSYQIKEYSRGVKLDRGTIIFDCSSEFRDLDPDEKVLLVDGQLNLRTKNMAFGYFTQICKHCYWHRIKKEELHRETLETVREKVWNDMCDSGLEGWDMIRKPRFGCDEEECFFND